MNKKLLVLLSVVSVNLLASNLFAMRAGLPEEAGAAAGAAGAAAAVADGVAAGAADINAVDRLGRTALHRAALRGDIATVRELIDAGANMDIRDFLGNTPLHYARTEGIVKDLILAGANTDIVNGMGYTALHCAIQMDNVVLENSVRIVEILVLHDANTQARSVVMVHLGHLGRRYRPIDLAREYLRYPLTDEIRDRLNRIIKILKIDKLKILTARRLHLADVIAAAERGMDGEGDVVPVHLLVLVDRFRIRGAAGGGCGGGGGGGGGRP